MDTKDIFAICGFLFTAGLGIFNFIETQNLKNRDLNLDEWKTQRTDLQKALYEFEDVLDRALYLSQNETDLGKLQKEGVDLNQKVAASVVKVVRQIDRATHMNVLPKDLYVWRENEDSAWDNLGETFNAIAFAQSPQACQNLFLRVFTIGEEMRRSMDRAIATSRVDVINSKGSVWTRVKGFIRRSK